MPLPPHVLLLKWQAWLRAGLGRLAAERVWEVELGRRVIRASTEATVRKRNIVCCGVRVTGMTSETPFANGHSTRSRALDGVSDSTAHADARLWLGAGKLTVQRAVRRQWERSVTENEIPRGSGDYGGKGTPGSSDRYTGPRWRWVGRT